MLSCIAAVSILWPPALAAQDRMGNVWYLGEVLYCPSAARLKKSPAHTATVRLVTVDEADEHPIGEYTFIHTPS